MKDGQNKLNMRADKATKTGAETAMEVLQKAASLRDKDRYRDRDSQAHREDFHIRRQTQTEGRRQPGGARMIPPHREKETGTETTGGAGRFPHRSARMHFFYSFCSSAC